MARRRFREGEGRSAAGASRRTRARLLALAALAIAALVASGCGTGGGPEARGLLQRAFAAPIGSANVTVELDATINGSGRIRGPVQLRFAGPFQSNGRRRIPSVDWSTDLMAGGRSLSAELLSNGADAYLKVAGASYDLGAARVAKLNGQLARAPAGRPLGALGIDPYRWLRDPHSEGDATVAGVDTTHVRAGVDVAAMVSDVGRAYARTSGALPNGVRSQLGGGRAQALARSIRTPTFDVYVGRADHLVRRAALSLDFTIPPGQRAQLGGLSGGTLSLSVELADIGRRFSFSAPADAQPLSALLAQLGAAAPSGRGAGASPGQLDAYRRCVRSAGANAAAAARCLKLLTR